MIKHLLHIIWNQRRKNGWIAAEILLVFVALWYIIDTMMAVGKVFYSPMGWSIDHVYLISMGVEGKTANEIDSAHYIPVGKSLLTAIDRIKTCPGVRSVGVGYMSMPYDQNSSMASISISDSVNIPSIKYNRVTSGYMETFDFRPAEGEKRSWEEMLSGNQIVMSDYLFQRLKTKGASRDKEMIVDGQAMSIGGLTASFRINRFSKSSTCLFTGLTDEKIAEVDDDYSVQIAVRVDPDADVDFPAFFAEKMERQLSIDRLYLLDVVPYKDLRDNQELWQGIKGELQNQMAVMGFLMFNIFLGIIGTFWFRTEQRKGEMGLRVALGSTRMSLQGIMMSEGLLLLTLVAIPACVVCLNLHLFELTKSGYIDFTLGRFLAGIAITYLIIAAMILLGIWYPARQASRLEPAEALHYE